MTAGHLRGRTSPARLRLLTGLLVVGLAAALTLGFLGPDGDAGPDEAGSAPADAGRAAAPEAAPAAAAPVPARVAAKPIVVPRRASGRLVVVPGSARAPGRGVVRRYVVEVEPGLPVDPQEFASTVHRILNGPRGWGRGGRTMRFWRVSKGPAPLRIALTSPALTDKLCHLETRGIYSCAAPSRVLLNARRWTQGAPSYAGRLTAYREYMVHHEVGHTLGRGHVGCPGKGRVAPVMMQQTKGLGGCRANPFPYR
jgi:Protein of unknown function (DUF3152)